MCCYCLLISSLVRLWLYCFIFFILSLLSAFWYFFALARFAFRVPRGAIFAGASRDQSLQSSPMPWWVLSVFCLISLS